MKLLAALAILICVAEIGARVGLGLGTPPLSVAHPTIEYMFAPNQNVSRFHRRTHINAWGMRSPDIDKAKPPGQYRVLVLGDSVLNGGVIVDQSNLATSQLTTGSRLYLNASAGSWGPPNMLAYVREFGTFDADAVVIVVSSHDAFDVPTFAPLSPLTHPTEEPISALYEGVTRYAIPVVVSAMASPVTPQLGDVMPAFKDLLNTLSGRPICVVQHITQAEIRSGEFESGHALIGKAAHDAGAVVIDDAEYMDLQRSFRDNIHLSVAGQADLKRAIEQCF
jgi:hypothetical protein